VIARAIKAHAEAVVLVPRVRASSQECPLCHHVHASNRVSRSLFICQVCEFTEHADVVGAMNVKNRAVVKGLGEEGLEVVATAATVSTDPLDLILGFADGTSVTVRQELTPLNCFGALAHTHTHAQTPRAGRELGRMRLSLKRKQEKSHRTVALAQAAAPIPTSQEAFA
jgi:ribosomal protein L37AE/L43A